MTTTKTNDVKIIEFYEALKGKTLRSALAKAHKAALEGGWDITVYDGFLFGNRPDTLLPTESGVLLGTVTLRCVAPDVTAPKDSGGPNFVKEVWATYDVDGALLRAFSLAYRARTRIDSVVLGPWYTNILERPVRVVETLDGQSPVRRAEARRRQAEITAVEDARRAEAKTALEAASQTQEVQDYLRRIASELLSAENDLANALDSIADRVATTQEALKTGAPTTGTFGKGPFAGNHAISEATHAASRVDLLRQQADHLAFLFGPLPKVQW